MLRVLGILRVLKNNQNEILRILRILRILKIFRLLRIMSIFSIIYKFLKNNQNEFQMKNNIKVQIVYPIDGWILQKFGEYLVNGIDFATGSPWESNDKIKWDLTYFMNYRLYKSCNSLIIGGYFTHEENKHFKEIARKVDFTVCMCERYKEVLDTIRNNNYVIYQPTDLERLKPFLKLGYSGILERSERKGKDLLKIVSKLQFVKLKITNGKLKEDQMVDFYNSLDYILITSKIEGGPMSLTEGLACGREIITSDVGMVPELKDCKYIHIYDRKNPQNLINLLEDLYKKKLEIRKNVEHFSIDTFVNNHRELFLKMIKIKK